MTDDRAVTLRLLERFASALSLLHFALLARQALALLRQRRLALFDKSLVAFGNFIEIFGGMHYADTLV